jgi:hypothetical protein
MKFVCADMINPGPRAAVLPNYANLILNEGVLP